MTAVEIALDPPAKKRAEARFFVPLRL